MGSIFDETINTWLTYDVWKNSRRFLDKPVKVDDDPTFDNPNQNSKGDCGACYHTN